MKNAPISPKTHAPQVRVYPDLDALSQAAAEALVGLIETTLAAHDRFALALAGGGTPRHLYQLLAGPYRERIPWDRLYLFWGDERYVPYDHPESNYRTAHEAFIRYIPIPRGHVFPIPTQAASPEAAAEAYASTLNQFFAGRGPAFDLALLGLGADGHTASLFAENAPHTVQEQDGAARWVEAVIAPSRYPTRPRITLTLAALNQTRHVFFLVSGAGKRETVQTLLNQADPSLPAAHVRAREHLTWFVDEAAYAK